ncbi:hypothetical protein B0H17DRAFT_548218 [Mycena rosella]|uniref:Uncharacterized protein n=1 Tax=Mycena rosella TaxID=1033263 RepID=A0AAD7GFF7_MYCRO|nr:hypothetical protein B0H17DRAFT_548218 [Mycena rosella]
MPQDTLSITIFAGGELALPWTVNVSDPALFDLVLVGVQGGATVFPGVRSTDSPLKLLVQNSPQTGVTLAESSTFEVTAGPRMFPASSASGTDTFSAEPTTTEALPNPVPTQAPTTASRRPTTDIIIGVVVGNTVLILVAILIWWYRARRQRQRGTSAHPVPIEDEDDDAVSKSDPPLLPVHTQVSPFPISHPSARMSPLRVPHLRPASDSYSSSSPPSRKSSSYYPTSPASTRRPASKYQSAAKQPPGMSQHAPTRTSHSRQLSYGLQPASPAHRRKRSYDLQPASPHGEWASYLPNPHLSPHRASTMPLPRDAHAPFRTHRLELQVELEAALSETMYDKDEPPETPSKTPTPRRPPRLRCMSEPLSPEFEVDSADAHAVDELVREARQSVSERSTDVSYGEFS